MDHTKEEKIAIKSLAALRDPVPSIRDKAISAHRAFIMRATARQGKKPGGLPYGNPYFEFMREVDTPVPDLLLRNRYRKKVMADVPK